MAYFHYGTIDHSRPSFRLLRLLKGDGLDLHCEIFLAWLDETELVPYEALSYTWGSTAIMDNINVDGQKLRITPNLYAALQQLRYKTTDRILWVDAICIDQRNEAERGHQVQQMGQIYQQADRVLFWLGNATQETDAVFDSLCQLQEGSKSHACRNWKNSDPRWKDLWHATKTTVNNKHLVMFHLCHEGLGLLLARPWFKRVWILQEVANARSALVHCGTKSIRARFFALAPLLMGIRPQSHCQAVLDIMPGPSRDVSWSSETQELYMLMQNFGTAQASDSRDLVYALLGMSSDARRPGGLKADYSKLAPGLIHDTCQFLFFGGIDASRTSKLSTIEDFLTQLAGLNNEAIEKFLDTFSEADQDILIRLLKRGNIEASNILKIAVRLLVSKDTRTVSTGILVQIVLSMIPKKFKASLHHLHPNKTIKTGVTDHPNGSTATLPPLGSPPVMLDLLLDRGVNIDLKDRSGQTLLSFAAERGYTDIMERLLKRAAKIESMDSNGWTPLTHATIKGQEMAMQLLLKHGVDINVGDQNGRTPLSHAVINGQGAAMQLLLHKKADMEAKDNDGHTSLSHAASRDQLTIMGILLEQGADIETKDRQGQTPLSHTAGKNQEAAMQLLLDRGAYIETKDERGQTPLSHAANRGHDAAVRLLLDKGANPLSKDESGLTPQEHARLNKHFETSSELKDHVKKRREQFWRQRFRGEAK